MKKVLKIMNLLFFIFMIVVNGLGEYLPLGKGSTGEISAKYPNLFTPAPITFSIWGIIYLLVAIFTIYQLCIKGNDPYPNQLVTAIGCWFIISCCMNIGWMISWHYDIIWLSLVFMLGLLFSLIMISNAFQSLDNKTPLTHVSCAGFQLYLGWICAATIANVSVFLVKINWNRFGLSEQLWTIIALLLAATLAILFIFISNNFFSAAGIIWAFCGILIKHISKNGYNKQYSMIIFVAILCIVMVVASIPLRLSMTYSKQVP